MAFLPAANALVGTILGVEKILLVKLVRSFVLEIQLNRRRVVGYPVTQALAYIPLQLFGVGVAK